MADEAPSQDGLSGSLQRTAGSLLGLARGRLELFGIELQEEKLRTLNLLVWFSVAIALAVAGLLVAIAAVALFLWDAAGYLGLAGLVLVTLGGSGAVLWVLRRRILEGPSPFAGTVAEFNKDLACLRRPE